MNVRRDALLYIIEAINQIGAPGKKAMQKLVYILQRRGVDFQLPFQIHFYGPYSSALDYTLQSFERQGLIHIEQKGSSSLVKLSPYTWEEVERDDLVKEISPYVRIIEEVLTEYAGKTPRELELLTTVDYVYSELAKRESVVDPEKVCDVVTQLKGSKFDIHDIFKAVETMCSCTCPRE